MSARLLTRRRLVGRVAAALMFSPVNWWRRKCENDPRSAVTGGRLTLVEQLAAGESTNKWKLNPGLLFLLRPDCMRPLNRILWVCVDAGCRGYSPLKGTFSNKQHLLVCFLQPSSCSDAELALLC